LVIPLLSLQPEGFVWQAAKIASDGMLILFRKPSNFLLYDSVVAGFLITMDNNSMLFLEPKIYFLQLSTSLFFVTTNAEYSTQNPC
jgi:hypothetical protein